MLGVDAAGEAAVAAQVSEPVHYTVYDRPHKRSLTTIYIYLHLYPYLSPFLSVTEQTAEGAAGTGAVEEDETAEELGEGVGVATHKIASFLQRVRDSHTALTNKTK